MSNTVVPVKEKFSIKYVERSYVLPLKKFILLSSVVKWKCSFVIVSSIGEKIQILLS